VTDRLTRGATSVRSSDLPAFHCHHPWNPVLSSSLDRSRGGKKIAAQPDDGTINPPHIHSGDKSRNAMSVTRIGRNTQFSEKEDAWFLLMAVPVHLPNRGTHCSFMHGSSGSSRNSPHVMLKSVSQMIVQQLLQLVDLHHATPRMYFRESLVTFLPHIPRSLRLFVGREAGKAHLRPPLLDPRPCPNVFSLPTVPAIISWKSIRTSWKKCLGRFCQGSRRPCRVVPRSYCSSRAARSAFPRPR